MKKNTLTFQEWASQYGFHPELIDVHHYAEEAARDAWNAGYAAARATSLSALHEETIDKLNQAESHGTPVEHSWFSQAALDVTAERRRQVEGEGWTPEHDDEYRDNELLRASACYALGLDIRFSDGPVWPWDQLWWKPTSKRRNLVKAAALILAEIERLDRDKPELE